MKTKIETDGKEIEEIAQIWAKICIQILEQKRKQNGDKNGK